MFAILLRQIGVAHDVLLLRNQSERGIDVDESPVQGEMPETYVERICRAKAAAAAHVIELRRLLKHPLIAADTTVSIGGEILGKPVDKAHAAAIRRQNTGPVRSGDDVNVLLSLGLAIGSRARQTPIRGGLILEVSGQVVGAIGVSAGTEDEDTEVAKAGVAAFVKG